MKKTLQLLLISVLMVSTTYAADLVTLNNGMKFQGKILNVKKNKVIFQSGDEKYSIPSDQISLLEFEDTTSRLYNDLVEISQEAEQDNCSLGMNDAKNFHGKKGGHIALGVFFGPFAILGTAIAANPTPYNAKKAMMISTNKEIFSDPSYLQCYKKQAKGDLIIAELEGWALWILFVIAAS